MVCIAPLTAEAASCCAFIHLGDKLQLQGLCAFDAAVHCASMTSWPTASQQNAVQKQQIRAASWLKQLFRKALSRLDLSLGFPVTTM